MLSSLFGPSTRGINTGTITGYANEYADMQNGISKQTASGYVSKSLLREHMPFVESKPFNPTLSLTFNNHFIAAYRRWLSGETTYFSDEFGNEEQRTADMYTKYVEDTTSYKGDLLKIAEDWDNWLVKEVMLKNRHQLDRDYWVNTYNYSK